MESVPLLSLSAIALVPVVVWVGVFFYTLSLDRKLARMEARTREDDL
jgi:CcmD family protein